MYSKPRLKDQPWKKGFSDDCRRFGIKLGSGIEQGRKHMDRPPD
jgi:hypothetical protein